MKKANRFSIADHISQEPKPEKTNKSLERSDLEQFTKKEVKEFIDYNESITTLDEKYSTLSFRNRMVLVRMFIKDFTQKSDSLHYSKMEYLKIASGIDDSVIYDEFPNPFPFTRKAVVVSSNIKDLSPGKIVALHEKPTVVLQKQDQGYPVIRGGFIHPSDEDDYMTPPQDPKDPNYGYVLINEQNIQLIF